MALGLGQVLLPVLYFSPARIIPPLPHTHPHLHIALARRTNGNVWKLSKKKKKCSFGNCGAKMETYFHLVFKGSEWCNFVANFISTRCDYNALKLGSVIIVKWVPNWSVSKPTHLGWPRRKTHYLKKKNKVYISTVINHRSDDGIATWHTHCINPLQGWHPSTTKRVRNSVPTSQNKRAVLCCKDQIISVLYVNVTAHFQPCTKQIDGLFWARYRAIVNLLKSTGHVMHQQFNIQQLYVLPTLYLYVLYLSENKQRLVPLTA